MKSEPITAAAGASDDMEGKKKKKKKTVGEAFYPAKPDKDKDGK